MGFMFHQTKNLGDFRHIGCLCKKYVSTVSKSKVVVCNESLECDLGAFSAIRMIVVIQIKEYNKYKEWLEVVTMGDKSPKNKEKKKKKADKKVTSPIASSAATVTKAQKTY